MTDADTTERSEPLVDNEDQAANQAENQAADQENQAEDQAADQAEDQAGDQAADQENQAEDQAENQAEDQAAEADAAEAVSGDDLEDRLVAEGEIAGDYLEELLDLLDFDGDIDLDVEGDRAVVSIDGGDDLNKLVGRKGEVLDAVQELTRLAVHQKTGERSRLMLDIARWRRRRRDELAALGDKVARRVLETGDREELAPMTPFERKIVHDAVAAVDGVRSESEGVEPSRRVVILLDRAD